MPRAHGRIVDGAGVGVVGHLYFYRAIDFEPSAWRAMMSSDERPVTTTIFGRPLVWTGIEADAVPTADRKGYFDVPGGLPVGNYWIDVHGSGGQQRWAWPFRVTGDGVPMDVRIGGPSVGVPGGNPDPTLAKQFTPGTFTASFSYYGGIGAPLDRVKRDFERFRGAGFQNYRLWVDWPPNRCPDSSCFTSKGDVIPALADKLTAILDIGAGLGLSADLTMHAAFYDAVKTSSEGYDITCHKDALRALLNRWGRHLAVRVVDVANEGEVRGEGGHGSPDTGHVSPKRFGELMAVARSVPRTCLVGISISSGGDKGDVIENAKIMYRDTLPEILLGHWPRTAGWGSREGTNGKKYQAAFPKVAIVFNDEPARNNYNGQSWSLGEFEASFRSAKSAGLHGQCFHTGAGFDLRTTDAWLQLDATERQVVASVKAWVG